MVVSGGVSIVYSDAIAAHSFAHELANYEEYPGVPSKGQMWTISEQLFPAWSGKV